jgi:site-specific DNA-cytosine methylase
MENVGALAVRGLDRVLGSLAEIGYDAVWQDIRASDVGAPHRRERIWIVAYPESDGCLQRNAPQNGCEERKAGNHLKERQDRDKLSERMGEDVAYTDTERQPWWSEYPDDARNMPRATEKRCPDVPYAGCEGVHEQRITGNAQRNSERQRGIPGYGLPGWREKESGDLAGQQTAGIIGCGEISDTGNIWSVKRQRELRSDQQTIRTGKNNGRGAEIDAIWEWWTTEPPVCCLVDGLPSGMDGYEGRICHKSYQRSSQLKGLGNAIVPHIAMLIWLMIKEFVFKEGKHAEK